MTMLWKTIRKRGFTLVELLVVIAIIGILVSIVMPAIADALFRGRLTASAANGRNIVQSIMALETENIYGNSSVVWPMHDTSSTGKPDYFTSSNDYFYWMLSNEVMNVSPSYFWAQGLTKADSLDSFDENANAWCVVADVSSRTPETTPVVFTRNLGQGSGTFDSLDDNLGVTNANNDQVPGIVDGAPFQNKGFIFVTKGGAAYALFKQDMRGKNFTNIFQVGTNKNEVLRPADASW